MVGPGHVLVGQLPEMVLSLLGHLQLRIEDVGHPVELDLHPAVGPGIPVHSAADGLRIVAQLSRQEAEDGGIAIAVASAGVQHGEGLLDLPALGAPFIGLRPPKVGKVLHGIVEGGTEQLLPGESRVVQPGEDPFDEPVCLLIPAGIPAVGAEVQVPYLGIPEDDPILPGPVDLASRKDEAGRIVQTAVLR